MASSSVLEIARDDKAVEITSTILYYAFYTVVVVLAAFYAILWIVIPRILRKRDITINRGWLSLKNLEWSNTSSSSQSPHSTTVQRVRASRVGLILGKGSPKNTGLDSYETSSALSELASLRWGWIGIGASGIRVDVVLTPVRDSDLAEPAAHTLEDAPVATVSMSTSQPDGHRSRSHSIDADHRDSGQRAKQRRPLSLFGLLARIYHASRAFHSVRRQVRSALLDSLPRRYRVQIARAMRFCRHRLLQPFLHSLNTLARRMNYISALVALEMKDIRIECSEIGASLSLDTARTGLELVRGSESHLSAWLRLEGLVTALVAASQAENEPKATSKKTAKDIRRPLRIAGPVVLEARADFDNEIGIASLYHRNADHDLEPRKTILDAKIMFPRIHQLKHDRHSRSDGKERTDQTRQPGSLRSRKQEVEGSVEIRLDDLLDFAERFKRSVQPDLHFDPHMKLHMHARNKASECIEPSREGSLYESDAESIGGAKRLDTRSLSPENAFPRHYTHQHAIRPQQNPVAMLKSLHLCIPLITATSSFRLGDGEHAEKPKQRMGGYANKLRLRGLAMELAIGPTLREGNRHIEWFGRQSLLKGSAKVGFESCDLEVTAIRRNGRKLSNPHDRKDVDG